MRSRRARPPMKWMVHDVTTQVTCRGFPARWINAWLAGAGATVLSPALRLHWTRERTPHAVVSSASGDPVQALADAWPSRDFLNDLPIAERWRNMASMSRRVAVERFVERARAARGNPFSWALSSTMTDLYVDKQGTVPHAPFDPAGPGTIKWLHHRLVKVHGHIGSTLSPDRLLQSLQGRAPRVKDNGLGFDLTRLSAAADKTANRVDPIVEVLVFFGLALLPIRGPGADERLGGNAASGGRAARRKVAQRGWRRDKTGDRALRFRWPVWHTPLDHNGIDALLDLWSAQSKAKWPLADISGGWKTVRYMQKDGSDPTRAFGSERI